MDHPCAWFRAREVGKKGPVFVRRRCVRHEAVASWCAISDIFVFLFVIYSALGSCLFAETEVGFRSGQALYGCIGCFMRVSWLSIRSSRARPTGAFFH